MDVLKQMEEHQHALLQRMTTEGNNSTSPPPSFVKEAHLNALLSVPADPLVLSYVYYIEKLKGSYGLLNSFVIFFIFILPLFLNYFSYERILVSTLCTFLGFGACSLLSDDLMEDLNLKRIQINSDTTFRNQIGIFLSYICMQHMYIHT